MNLLKKRQIISPAIFGLLLVIVFLSAVRDKQSKGGSERTQKSLMLLTQEIKQEMTREKTKGIIKDEKIRDYMSVLHGSISRTLHKNGSVMLDFSRPSYQLWKGDGPSSPCFQYHTRFGIKMTPVYLASYPASGNTWLRYLLEGATGVFTGSVYKSSLLYHTGFLGEMVSADNRKTLVQKTHMMLTRLNDPRATILLIRNPFNAIISYFKSLRVANRTLRHVQQIPLETFETPDFHKRASVGINEWERLYKDRLLIAQSPLYVLYYENLVNNTMYELRRLLNFLRIPVDEGRLACVMTHLDGKHKRTNSTKFDPYRESTKYRMLTAVNKVKRLLVALGYPEPPDYPELAMNLKHKTP